MIKILLTFLTILTTTHIFGQALLQQTIEQVLSTKKADVGISILNLENGDTININGNKHYPMISVFKFHIALTVLNLVDRGDLSLYQKLLIKKSELLENTWSPFREKYPNGNISITLKEALQWTIVEGDNNLCDILIRLVGGVRTIEKFIDNPNFVIKNNEEEMHENWDAQFLNTITPSFSNEILKRFLENKILSIKSTKFLYKTMMKTSAGENRIKGKLPPKTKVAHRTGSSFTNDAGMTGAINNIGIVELPNENHFIISVFVHNTTEEINSAEEIIADIAKEAWDFYTKNITKGLIRTEIKRDTLTLFDQNRNRIIPIAIYQPKKEKNSNNIPILFNHGYGENSGNDYLNAYTYLTEFLASQGYFVVSIQHELKTDEPLAMSGILKETRLPSWERGVLNMQYVLKEIKVKYPKLKFDELSIIGHSQGGDMVALFAQKHPEIVKKIITMDNRRMKIPIVSKPRIFTLRSNDYPADEGVLPTNEEKKKNNITVEFTNINHSNMDNDANETERVYLQRKILEYLKN